MWYEPKKICFCHTILRNMSSVGWGFNRGVVAWFYSSYGITLVIDNEYNLGYSGRYFEGLNDGKHVR